MRVTCLLSLTIALGNCLSAQAAIVNIPVARETTLFQTNPDDNLGSSNVVAGTTNAGQGSRGILEFDIASSIPTESTINSVAFQIGIVRQSNQHVPSAYALHRFLKDWNEGVGGLGVNGSPALAGETTWNSQYHGTTLWSASGGQAGVEYLSTASGAGPEIDVGLGIYAIATTAALVSDVQAWLDNPAANHGWYFLAVAEPSKSARRFSSTEEPEGGLLPQITVNYTLADPRPVPEPATLALSGLGLGVLAWFGKRRRGASA